MLAKQTKRETNQKRRFPFMLASGRIKGTSGVGAKPVVRLRKYPRYTKYNNITFFY